MRTANIMHNGNSTIYVHNVRYSLNIGDQIKEDEMGGACSRPETYAKFWSEYLQERTE
jgi:hypothetical protein